MLNGRWIKLPAVVLIAASLAACGGGAGGSDPGSKASVAEQGGEGSGPGKKPSGEPVEIVFYSDNGDPQESFEYRYGDLLRKKFPQYKISYIQAQKGAYLNDLLMNGTKFDIFYATIGNFEWAMLENELQFDMTELIKKHNVDLNRIEPSLLEALQQMQGGKMYALPIATANMVLYYNKDLFDKFGVSYPTDDMTWEQTLEMSKKLTRKEDSTQYFGFATSFPHIIRMNPLSIPNVDLKTWKPTIHTDERWKTFFKTFFIDPAQDAGYQGYMQSTNSIPGLNQFVKDQTVAMYAYLSSLIYAWPTEMQSFNWDWAALPHFKESPGFGSQSYPFYFGITKRSTHPDEAMEVLKYMLSDEVQASLSGKGIMPAVKTNDVIGKFGKESPFHNRRMQAAFHNKFAPIPPKAVYDANIVNIYVKYANAVHKNEMDLNTALSRADEEAAKFIADYKQK
ncbi:extracellular solute-binding protein [Paenibacillus sp. GYB004]|uniref:ABC transporter substrate-binding protein n=1 Tax=Paenibacillus sp. GYB004 TaxID=2994393 RepID=UPI002F960C5F